MIVYIKCMLLKGEVAFSEIQGVGFCEWEASAKCLGGLVLKGELKNSERRQPPKTLRVVSK